MTFKPFADEAASSDVAGLTFENHTDRIAIYGQALITRDQQGLAQATLLHAQLSAIMMSLKAADLSVEIKNKPIVMVDNPFESK
jgi:hypothetical protein